MINWIKNLISIEQPDSLTMSGWDEWEKSARKNHPIKYFLSETIPDMFSDTIAKRYNIIKYWIRYRTVDRYHVVDTKLRPDYYDIDTRLMHSMFSLIVDFVEVEKAWVEVVFDDKDRYKQHTIPWWSYKKYTRLGGFRDVTAGLNHLKWEMTLDSDNIPIHDRNPSQANAAREIWVLYHWWTKIRPIRPEPEDAVGLTDWYRSKNFNFSLMFSSNLSKEEIKERRELTQQAHEIEDAYRKEDEEMMIKVIKIRGHLWT